MAISENTKRLIVLMPKELYSFVEEQAKDQHRSISNMMVVMAQEYIDNHASDSQKK